MKLKILKELEYLIPKMSDQEYKELEELILSEGCRDSIVIWNDVIVDGHNRYKICTNHNIKFNIISREFVDLDQAKYWMIRNQLGRRNLRDNSRVFLAYELKKILLQFGKEKERTRKTKTTFNKSEKSLSKKINTNKEVYEITGVSHNTIIKLEHILNSGEEDLKSLVINNEFTIDRAEKERKNREKERIRKEFSQKGKSFDADKSIKHGDFNKVLAFIEPGSIKAIITDPPYPEKYLDCYSQVAEFAKDKLCENGFLVCYAGQYFLPEVMARLGKHLEYYWTIGMIHQGHTTLVKPLNVICDWKPILFYLFCFL